MIIALDAVGGDRAPAEVVRGAVNAARELGIEVALVGPPDAIDAELRKSPHPVAGVSIVPAREQIEMDESPLEAVRRKRESSIAVGIELVKSGRAQAFVSAGNTGAVMAAATLLLGRLPQIERPALGAVMPVKDGARVLLLDAGATADCRPSQLVQFAQMGQAYVREVLAVAEPRVGLISIGEEDSKGNQLVVDANQRLRRLSSINFAGNIESKDVAGGAIDVAVTDGFTGNIILKAAEGTADYIVHELRLALTARPHYQLAAAMLRPAFAQLRRRLDYAEYGGAPLLGVRGLVLIAHGRSDARAITSALRAARDAAAVDVVGSLTGAVND
ncbi:MAG TPA: phosphate acyltransferase PlsX [Dehalococcoidia bacterium]|nr:phosphate acyltransferase PlsX [Dehalococcoidia bacterium]